MHITAQKSFLMARASFQNFIQAFKLISCVMLKSSVLIGLSLFPLLTLVRVDYFHFSKFWDVFEPLKTKWHFISKVKKWDSFPVVHWDILSQEPTVKGGESFEQDYVMFATHKNTVFFLSIESWIYKEYNAPLLSSMHSGFLQLSLALAVACSG